MHWANEIGDRKRLVNTEVYSLFKRFTLFSSTPPFLWRNETFCNGIMAPLFPMKRVGERLSCCHDCCCCYSIGLVEVKTPSCDFDCLQAGFFDWITRVETTRAVQSDAMHFACMWGYPGYKVNFWWTSRCDILVGQNCAPYKRDAPAFGFSSFPHYA